MLIPAAAVLTFILSGPPQDEPAAEAPTARPFARRALIPLAVSGAAFVGGGLFLGISALQATAAAQSEGEPAEALRFNATSNRVGGVMLLATGALTGLIAVFLFQFAAAPPIAVSVSPMRGGTFVSLEWRAL